MIQTAYIKKTKGYLVVTSTVTEGRLEVNRWFYPLNWRI